MACVPSYKAPGTLMAGVNCKLVVGIPGIPIRKRKRAAPTASRWNLQVL